jgi:uncharacterized protein (TIGR03790 family)
MKTMQILRTVLLLIPLTIFSYDYDDPGRVLVVYNTNGSDRNANGTRDSKEIADYYALRRNIPQSNLLGLALSKEGNYHRDAGDTAFYNELVVPIRNKLNEIGQDSIYYIVLCKSVPYWIYLSPASDTTTGSVDAKLAMIFNLGDESNYTFEYNFNPYYEFTVLGASVNGHFDHSYQLSGENMYLVCRLEGHQEVQAIKDMIDRALYAERYVWPGQNYYNGFGYVDTRYSLYSDTDLENYPYGYYTYQNADKDMAYAKYFIDTAGYELKWETNETEIGEATARFHDNTSADSGRKAMWYGGWYNFGRYLDAWEWLPGAVACDLNSDSYKQFLKGAFTNGLTAGCGVVAEPRLNGHTQPEKLLWALFKGYTFGEAAYLADPRLGWMTVNNGDPLYCPHHQDKTPVMDDVIPLQPRIVVRKLTATSQAIFVYMNFGIEPEIVQVKTEWGTTSSYSNTIDFDNNYTTCRTCTLPGLAAGTNYHFQVTLKDPVGNETVTSDLVFNSADDSTVFNLPVDMRTGSERVAGASLRVRPNPFSRNLSINCRISGLQNRRIVKAQIYNVSGQVVHEFLNPEIRQFGDSEITWDATASPNGIYIIKIKTERHILTKRITLLK